MAEPPTEQTPSHSAPTNLSSLRRSWSDQHLPSFPVTDQAMGRESSLTTQKTKLPELPSLGAIASKAVFAMDGYEELFGHDHCSDFGPPQIDISEVPTENSIFEQMPSPQSASSHTRRNKTVSIPLIPAPALADATTPRAHRSEAAKVEKTAKTTGLSAMPVMEAPSISIPLVRDQFREPSDFPTDIHVKQSASAPTAESSATTPTPTPLPTEPSVEVPAGLPTPPATTTSRTPAKPVAQSAPRSATPQTPEKQERPETQPFTDEDLREALQPIIDPCVDKFLYTPTQGIHTYLEPMLRSTVRRAIAEQMEDSSPFREVSGWDKLAWKMRAAFTSRTYEDIVFDVTKRYQVEEVFLLRPHTRSLISYASHDPSRHAKPAKVEETVKRIASKTNKTGDKTKDGESSIKWENTRNLMIRRGKHCILAAIVHGPSTAILRADLDYALRQAEERFGKTLQDENDIHLQILQPLLEGCLLIQAPAIPN